MSAKTEGVHPELRGLARLLPRSLAMHRGTKVQRAVSGAIGSLSGLRGVEVASVNPHVRVRIHRPASSEPRVPALLWMHGGGYFMGVAAQDDKFARKLANHVDAAVVSVDYRLAPEHPFPAPIEDCYSALLWLARQPWVDADRIAIGGASAGGGLAASLAHLAVDRAEVHPVLQMLVYPMLDDRTGAESERPGALMWNGRDNQIAWDLYAGNADRARVAAARRENLAGVAPAWLGVGTCDLFHDETVAYAKRLKDAGVPTECEFVAGAFHTFDVTVSGASISQRFFASQVRALRAALIDSVTAAGG